MLKIYQFSSEISCYTNITNRITYLNVEIFQVQVQFINTEEAIDQTLLNEVA